VSLDRTLTFPRPKLAEPTDQRSRMHRHEWAVDRLWEGLIAPSDSSWAEGADVLESAPFMPQLAVREGGEAIETLGQRLHAFGRRAAAESSAEGRAKLYGELLTTCASCHALTAKAKLR
jgi:cytochrome c553